MFHAPFSILYARREKKDLVQSLKLNETELETWTRCTELKNKEKSDTEEKG